MDYKYMDISLFASFPVASFKHYILVETRTL